jgi:hypothetical protein
MDYLRWKKTGLSYPEFLGKDGAKVLLSAS